MYSKTSLGTDQTSSGPSLSPRRKRILLAIAGVVVAALIAVGVYSALGHDQYGPSANGCVNLTIAGTTGGGTLHYCGGQAKAVCRKAYTSDDRLSQLARPQCVLAGLTRAKVSAG
jgi:hypothetical protein